MLGLEVGAWCTTDPVSVCALLSILGLLDIILSIIHNHGVISVGLREHVLQIVVDSHDGGTGDDGDTVEFCSGPPRLDK